MHRTSILTVTALSLLGFVLGGCPDGGTLDPGVRGVLVGRIKALEPIAAMHEGQPHLAPATDEVFNEFVRAMGFGIRTVNRANLQQLLDQQASSRPRSSPAEIRRPDSS